MNKTQIYFSNLLFEIMNKKYVWNVVRGSYMYSEDNQLKVHIRKNSYILSYFPPTPSGIFVSVLQSMVKLKFCINVKCSASFFIGL